MSPRPVETAIKSVSLPQKKAPPRRTQQERTDATRTSLLRATIKVLVSKGYSQFTTAEVAHLAGTSRGALTHHFPSARALILAAVDDLYSSLMKRSMRRAAAAPMDGDILRPIIEDGKGFLLASDFISIYNTLSEIQRSGSKADVDEIGHSYRIPIERVWRDYLVRRGVEEECAENVVWATFSVLRGVTVRRILPHEPARADRTLEFAFEAIRKSIKYESSPAPSAEQVD